MKALLNRTTIYIEMQSGLLTRHKTTITATCRNATNLADLHAEQYSISSNTWNDFNEQPQRLQYRFPGEGMIV